MAVDSTHLLVAATHADAREWKAIHPDLADATVVTPRCYLHRIVNGHDFYSLSETDRSRSLEYVGLVRNLKRAVPRIVKHSLERRAARGAQEA